jgi:hypothetical protein
MWYQREFWVKGDKARVPNHVSLPSILYLQDIQEKPDTDLLACIWSLFSLRLPGTLKKVENSSLNRYSIHPI